MLVCERSLSGLTTMALDGVAGKVRDILFNDMNWEVLYIVVRTDTWPYGHIAVVPPARTTMPDWSPGCIPVDLRRQWTSGGAGIKASRRLFLTHHRDERICPP